jgi:hypothetical protein
VGRVATLQLGCLSNRHRLWLSRTTAQHMVNVSAAPYCALTTLQLQPLLQAELGALVPPSQTALSNNTSAHSCLADWICTPDHKAAGYCAKGSYLNGAATVWAYGGLHCSNPACWA